MFSLWIGGKPSIVALASMRSFTALGHPYTLYAYEPPEGLPAGVVLADAEQVLPRAAAAYLLERRAASLVSNLFRYARLRGGGLWVDTDVIALRQLDFPEGELVFGRQDPTQLNGAVLGAPAGHPLVAELHRRSSTPWRSYLVAEAAQRTGRLPRPAGVARRAVGIARHGAAFALAEAPWGTFGPRLITQVAREQGLTGQAREMQAFYPIGHRDVDLLLAPARDGERLLGEEVFAVHLWNELLRRRAIVEPPPGSLLERLLHPGAPAQAARATAPGRFRREPSSPSAAGIDRTA